MLGRGQTNRMSQLTSNINKGFVMSSFFNYRDVRSVVIWLFAILLGLATYAYKQDKSNGKLARESLTKLITEMRDEQKESISEMKKEQKEMRLEQKEAISEIKRDQKEMRLEQKILLIDMAKIKERTKIKSEGN